MREFMAWPDHLLHRLPDGITDAGGGGAGAARRRHPRARPRPCPARPPGAVIGCGPIGLLLTQVLRAAGAGPVTAFDPLPHRRAAATRFGAAAALGPASRAGPSAHLGHVVGEGVDVAFEMAGTGEAVQLAMLATQLAGGWCSATSRPATKIALRGFGRPS